MLLALVMGRFVTVRLQRGALDFILAAWFYLSKRLADRDRARETPLEQLTCPKARVNGLLGAAVTDTRAVPGLSTLNSSFRIRK